MASASGFGQSAEERAAAQARNDSLAARIRAEQAGMEPLGNGDSKPALGRKQTAQAKPSANGSAAAPTFSAAALFGMDLPEARFAVDGIVPEGLTVLAGKPKLGKSWAALGIGLAVASGGVALGSVRVEQGRVLYLALEDTKRRLQSRLRKMLGRDGGTAPGLLEFQTAWPRQDKGGLQALGEWLDAHPDTRLVIIDTWQKFRPSKVRGCDAYEEDYEHAAAVKALADKYGIAILVFHHCRKLDAEDPVDSVSGTLGLTGCADAVLVLRRERGQHDAALFVTGRDLEEQELALRFDPQYALWSVAGTADEYRMSKERARAMEVLRQAGRFLTPTEAAPLLEKKLNTTKQLLWSMEREGWLKSDGRGGYGLGSVDANSANGTNSTNPANLTNQGGYGPFAAD